MNLKELLFEINKLAKDLGINQPWICGGLPRDKYLGRASIINDIDITTGNKDVNLLARAVAHKFKNLNAKLIFKKDHYSVKIGKITLDFSSNFISPYINNANISNLSKEMISRDFTINSLLMSIDLKKIYNPGKLSFKDLDNKIIDTCLSPEKTFSDSPNRAIRAIYLACKLNFNLSKRVEEYLKNNNKIFNLISKKYLIKKINECIKYNKKYFINLINKLNLNNILPLNYDSFKAGLL